MRSEARSFERLPVAVQPQPDECGLGFLLRCARANGMDLDTLVHWGGAHTLWSLDSRDIEALAFLVSVSPAWLADRLVQNHRAEGRRQAAYMGWAWSGPPALRSSHPQVCPECLAEKPYCRVAWGVTGLCACVKHGRLLLDHCRHCGKPVSWMRAAVDVCRCGRYLTRGDPEEGEGPTAATLDWCAWLDQRLLHGGPRSPRLVGGPLDWLAPLSPDGAYRLLHAMGILCAGVDRLTTASVTAIPAPEAVAKFIDRGLQRAAALPPPGLPAPSELLGLVYEPGVQRLARWGATDGDRQAGGYFVRQLARDPRHAVQRTGRPRQGQLELFNDDGS